MTGHVSKSLLNLIHLLNREASRTRFIILLKVFDLLEGVVVPSH